jgi:hypothetical protein
MLECTQAWRCPQCKASSPSNRPRTGLALQLIHGLTYSATSPAATHSRLQVAQVTPHVPSIQPLPMSYGFTMVFLLAAFFLQRSPKSHKCATRPRQYIDVKTQKSSSFLAAPAIILVRKALVRVRFVLARHLDRRTGQRDTLVLSASTRPLGENQTAGSAHYAQKHIPNHDSHRRERAAAAPSLAASADTRAQSADSHQCRQTTRACRQTCSFPRSKANARDADRPHGPVH